MVKKMKDKNLTTKEKNKNKFAYFRIIFYIIMLSLTNILLAFLILHLSILSIIIALAMVIVLIIWTWRQPFQDNVLYPHDVSNMFGGVLLGILAAYWLSSQEKLISFLIPIAIIDFISFTRFGKGTPNRKLIENKTIAKRLSICMPIPGFSGLYQITGIGDMFVFALIVGATKFGEYMLFGWLSVLSLLDRFRTLLVCYLLRTNRGTVEFQQLRPLF